MDPLQPDFEAFQTFANKLAQVCDNERRGRSITVVCILKGDYGPIYIFAANRKGPRDTSATEAFLNKLLCLVGKNPEELRDHALQRRTLRLILSFNIARIEEYPAGLKRSLTQCLDICSRQEADDGEA